MKIREIFNDKTIVGSPALHFCKLVLVMMIIWLLLSGRLEIKFLAYGIATAVICSIICMPLMILNGISSDKKYFVFLLRQGVGQLPDYGFADRDYVFFLVVARDHYADFFHILPLNPKVL